jgi:hypothetical protein
MATISEEIVRLQILANKGRGEEKCHVILIEQEARDRIANTGPKPKTRFVMETDSPEMYSRFNSLKDRWLANANKSVALSVMANRWDVDEQDIKILCEDVPDEIRRDSDASA